MSISAGDRDIQGLKGSIAHSQVVRHVLLDGEIIRWRTKKVWLLITQDPVYIDPRVEVYAHWDDCNCPPISHCDLQLSVYDRVGIDSSLTCSSYHEASVRALALRAHGGPLGHAKHRSDAKA